MGLLLNGMGALVTQDMGKAELLNVLFISAFTGKFGLQKSKTLEGWQ